MQNGNGFYHASFTFLNIDGTWNFILTSVSVTDLNLSYSVGSQFKINSRFTSESKTNFYFSTEQEET